VVVRSGADLRVELCGLPLENPLMPAAGTLWREAAGGVRGVYGALLPKTVTREPRAGNPPPRVAETPAGMVNSIGLQNPGVERFLQELDDFDVGAPIFASAAGDTVDDYRYLCELFATEECIRAIELNLSCPNVKRGGLSFCAAPAAVEEVVAAAVKAAAGKPVIPKLTAEGVVENARAAEAAGASALTLVNTLPALTVDVRSRAVLVRGGLSGPAIKPVALRAVYEVSRVVAVPVVGCGGVATGTDVAEFMLAGASAVQVGSASFMRNVEEIKEEFCGYLKDSGLDARGLIKAAH
jgi:dihydroorotate dehydrogenase (NAD+) catalytic subunit